MKLKSFVITALAAAGLLGAASCNSTEVSGSGSDMFYIDIATLESTGDSGSVLTLQENGDSPIVTLLTSQQFKGEDFKLGDRILIYYHPESNRQFVSGNISVYQASTTLGKGAVPMALTAAQANQWQSEAINLVACWRTGPYLNIVFNASTSGVMRKSELYLDKETIGDRMPNYRFVYESTPGGQTNTYTFYASYNIGEVWNDDIDGIRITVPDNSLTGGNTITIIKQASTIIPAPAPAPEE